MNLIQKKESLRTKIIAFVKKQYPAFVSGVAIEDLAREEGYKASNASRRCRELVNDSIFESRYTNGYVSYKYAIDIDNRLYRYPEPSPEAPELIFTPKVAEDTDKIKQSRLFEVRR